MEMRLNRENLTNTAQGVLDDSQQVLSLSLAYSFSSLLELARALLLAH